MKKYNLKITLAVNIVRCLLAGFFLAIIVQILISINMIKFSESFLFLRLFFTAGIICIIMAGVTAFVEEVSILIFVLLLPGFILSDVILAVIFNKLFSIGYLYPLFKPQPFIGFGKVD